MIFLKRNYLHLLAVSILFVGILIRIIIINVDKFGLSYDDYFFMIGVEKSFSGYARVKIGFLSHLIHYWFSYRMFGNNMSSYLILPVFSSVLTLLTIYFGLKYFWHSPLITFLTLSLLAFNNHFLWLTGYPMFSYINTLLSSACLYFILLKLSSSHLNKKYSVIVTIGIIYIAFFSNVVFLLPVITGIFSVFAYRRLKHIKSSVKEFLPFIIFPLIYLIVFMLHPFSNHPFTSAGISKRPDMAPLFFHSSGFNQNLPGLISFSFSNSAKLFVELLVIDLPSFITRPLLLLGIFGGIFTVIRFLSGKEKDPKIRFTAIYFLITYSAILAGGILAIFPFGRARYNAFLLVPLVILMGNGMKEIIIKLSEEIKIIPSLWKRNAKVFSFSLAIIIFVSGSYFSLKKYQEITLFKQQNQSALEKIRQINTDQTFYTGYVGPVLYIKSKEIYDRGYDLGWGSEYAQKEKEILSQIKKENKILIINNPYSPLEQFPSFMSLIDRNYSLENQIDAPAISAKVYQRKAVKT